MLKVSSNYDGMYESLNKEDRRYDDIMVIGAGLPRTGTMSLKTALTQLYQAKCYHMMDVMAGDQEDIDIWMDAAEGRVSKERWRTYFRHKGYAAGVDYPFSLFYKQLMEVYPDAKVVLSTRNPKTWYTSVYNSIWQIDRVMSRATGRLLNNILDGRRNSGADFLAGFAGGKLSECGNLNFKDAIQGGPDVAERFFLDWEAAVRRHVPADRLLVHSAKEGWQPLCEFLGLPVPDGPYPRVNDTASIQALVSRLKMLEGLMVACAAAAAGGVAYYFRVPLTAGANFAVTACKSWMEQMLA